MQNVRSVVLVAGLVAALAAGAKEVKGVKLEDTTTVGDKTLKLNGAGVRKVFVFDVYVGALYVEEASQDPAAILGKDGVRQVQMTMLRDLEKEKIAEAIRTGFEKNSKDRMAALKDRMEKFIAQMPEKVSKGQVLRLTYVPGKGTTVTGQGEKALVEGKDFADALFSVWLGQHPVDDSLKKGMLGLE
jgi:chalcone isomerase-like protein